MTPTCVAPRHVDAPRDLFFLCAARLFLLLFFSCSADHERDWPPCKVVFFGLATNALNVRNNNNNNNNKCRESAGTGPVVVKVAPAKDAAFASPWTN